MNMRYAKRSEDTEQINVVSWAGWNMNRYPELKWLFHVPNGGSRNKQEAVKFKQMGVKAGVSDLCLPYPKGSYCGLFVEMKFGNNRQQDTQKEFLADMAAAGHFVATCYSAEEAINLIPEWKEELKKERLTFSAAYELSGMTEDEQRETLGKFSETGELTHKEVKDMKEAKAAGQQVSESDTEENGMNPPEARAGDDYETPHPEGITSLCYSCTEYETCNVKTGTCTSCDQYKNRAEAYKTDEQRYSEEQDAIDRETKKKLREMEQEEKMQKLPSTAPEEIKTIRVSQDKFEEYTGEYRKPYMITKDDGFKVGNVVKLVVFVAGKATGETADMRITCKDDDITCSGLSDGWCVIGLGVAQRRQNEL